MIKNKHKKILAVIIILVLLYFLYDYSQKNTKITITPPTVTIALPANENLAEYITLSGNTVAFNSVNLVARVEGYLQSIKFTDGAMVKKDDLLFIIEPEPYLENVKEAESALAAAQAQVEYSKAEYARQQNMYKQNATSLNSVEVWLAKSQEATANLNKAQANLVNAKISYSYTHVLAPFDGRIGRHLVDEGNLVGNGAATNLATIEQIKPLYVYFNLNELDFIRLRKAAQKEGITPAKINQIPIKVQIQNEQEFLHEGHLDFVNTGLNSSTGTMELRGILPNTDYALVPGLFVQVQIATSKAQMRLTIPDSAIMYDQIGPYIYLVDNNNLAQLQRIVISSVHDNRRIVNKGVRANDKVIVEGIQFVTVGKPVNPKVKV